MQLLEQSKTPVPFQRNHLIRDAISLAIYEEMERDESVHLFGEGAHVKMHYDSPKIEARFNGRVHTLPISEDGNTNFCVGASLLGIKPVIDMISSDFLYRAMDSICNTAAKINFVRPGQKPVTIVVRAEFLTGGPTTGQRPEALFTHIPGLNVVIPSTPQDAYGLMRTALAGPGVTLFFEDRMIEDSEFDNHMVASEPIPFGKALWCKMGIRGNVTIVSYGVMRQRVARLLSTYRFTGDYYGDNTLGAGLLDLRSIYPLDWEAIKAHLARTGKLLVVEPDITYGGVGAEIAARVAEEMPYVRVKRLGAQRRTIAASAALHDAALPSTQEIIDALTGLNND